MAKDYKTAYEIKQIISHEKRLIVVFANGLIVEGKDLKDIAKYFSKTAKS